MLVFDVTNEQSFDNITQWLKTVDKVHSHVAIAIYMYECDVFVSVVTCPKALYQNNMLATKHCICLLL